MFNTYALGLAGYSYPSFGDQHTLAGPFTIGSALQRSNMDIEPFSAKG